MAEGAVRFNGRPGTACPEALNYTVKNDSGEEVGGSTLDPGYTVEGLSEQDVKRFLMNANFTAEGSEGEQIYEDLQRENAEKAKAARLSSGEISAAVVAGIATEEEMKAAEQADEEQQEAPAVQQTKRVQRRGTSAAPVETTTNTGEASETHEGNAGEENS